MAVTTPPTEESKKPERPPRDEKAVPARQKRRHRILPRTVLGISAFVLAFSLGAALSGTVLYSYYAYRLGKTDEHVNAFIKGFTDSVKNAQGAIRTQQNSATADLNRQLDPLRKLVAEGQTIQVLLTKTQPSLYFVHTLDENGQASVGTAFAVASDSHQTLLLTSYNAVRAATRRPGPDLFVRRGTNDTKVEVFAWQPERDLALIILPLGNQPKLDFAPDVPSAGDRVFVASGLGTQGGSVSQGFVTDVSSAGIQHNVPTAPFYQGGPLMNSEGRVLGIASRAYAPLGFSTDAVWFAVPNKAACEKVLSCPNNSPIGAGAQGAPAP